jgi:hypothetical protein
MCASCAKFPDTAGPGNFARITFRMRVAGNINTVQDDTPLTNYVYIFAIRVLTTDETPNTGAPQPVVGENNPNGFVAGSPTHFVQFDPARNPTRPFTLYRFNPGPSPGDPTNPINLASWVETTSSRGPIIDQFDESTPNELRFDVFVNQLVNSDAEANTVRRLQVNLLTMNRLANQGSTRDRSWDALGDQRLPSEISTFVTVDLRTNQIVDNRQNIEPTGDVVNLSDPDLDISDFSIEVQQP